VAADADAADEGEYRPLDVSCIKCMFCVFDKIILSAVSRFKSMRTDVTSGLFIFIMSIYAGITLIRNAFLFVECHKMS